MSEVKRVSEIEENIVSTVVQFITTSMKLYKTEYNIQLTALRILKSMNQGFFQFGANVSINCWDYLL